MKFQITKYFDKIRNLWKDSKLSECIEIKNTVTFLRYRYRSPGRAQTVFTKRATRNRRSEMPIESLMERAVVSFFLRRFFTLSFSLLRVLRSPFKKTNKYYTIILNEQLDKTSPDLSTWKIQQLIPGEKQSAYHIKTRDLANAQKSRRFTDIISRKQGDRVILDGLMPHAFYLSVLAKKNSLNFLLGGGKKQRVARTRVEKAKGMPRRQKWTSEMSRATSYRY